MDEPGLIPMEVEFTTNIEDAIAFHRYCVTHDREGKPIPQTARWAWIAVLVVCVACAVASFDQGYAQGWIFVVLSLVVTGKLIGVRPTSFLMRWGVIKPVGLGQRQHYRIQSNGLFTQNPNFEGLVFWNGLEEVRTSEKLLLIVSKDRIFYAIPIRAFETLEALNDFKNEAQARIRQARREGRNALPDDEE